MAGIIVSGGTYSGSGDVTAEFFKATGTSWDVTLTNGVTELYGELPSGETLIIYWGGDSNAWKHNNGTVKFTNISTRVNTVAINPTGGAFYNVIVNNNADARGVNGVQFVTAASGAHLKIANNLTVTSGAAWTTKNSAQADYLLEVLGHCLVQESGAALFGDASFMNGGYNETRHGLLKIGSLQVNQNGYFSASSGTTGILGAPNGGYSMYIPDGGFYHSSGTVDVRFTGTDASQVRNKDDFYNYEQTLDTASYASARVNWRGKGSAPYQFTIANNLTIKEGAFRPTSPTNTIVVSGNVDVETGGTYGFSAGDFEAAASFGSVYNPFGNMYLSTGTTTITGPATSGYLWRTNAGTIHHNSGTVYFNTGSYNGNDIYPAPTQPFYNLIFSGSGTVEMFSSIIANNFTLGTDVTFRPITPTQTFTVSGTATMNGFFGKDGFPQTTATDNNFGALDINAGGTYYATSGATTITTGSFTDDGTFYHNSGEVKMQGAGTDIDGGATTTFYDLTSENFIDVTKSINVENTMKALGSNSWRFVTNQTIKMGTTTGSGRIEVGTASGKGMRFTNLNKTYKFEAANEAHPWVGISSGAGWNNGEPGNTIELKWCDMQFDLDTQGSGGDEAVTWKVANAEFDAVTVDSGDALIVSSGQRVAFGGTVTIPADGIIVSGALVEMKGAGNWSETGYQQHIGRATAALMWNSTGYYSPNGGYLNNGWKDVFWNADARINQDGPFRNSNLIVAKQFSASNRPIGSTTESQMLKSIRVLNGGTVSSSTNLFKIQNTGTFNTRGGFFASSSALTFDGTDDRVTIDENYDAIGTSNNFTVEGWFKTAVKTNYMHIFSRGSSWDTGNITVYMNSDGYIQASANDLSNTLTVSEDLSDGKWHHFAYTYDKTNVKLYVDGILEAYAAKTDNLNNVTTKSDIGTRGGAVNTWWNGEIGRISVWSSALTGPQTRAMMFQDFDTATTTNCLSWYQFDNGYGTVIKDNKGTQNGVYNGSWVTGGNWNANTLSGAAHTGKLYIGTGVTPTVFTNSTFELANRELIVGSKFASKSHKGTTEYYIATSGTNDYLNYQKIEAVAPIGTVSDVKILANGSHRSYFNFDSNANNEQCNTLVNAGVVRIITNADFYTQDFDNSQGEWIRNATYGGTIHDDGSTPHEYEPIDIMDDQDSNFDTSELID